MKILAIDPGYERLGIAIIEKENKQKEYLIYSECFKTSRDFSHAERLGLIQKKIEDIISKYKPEELAIETLFFTNNQKTALLVAEARGVIMATCQNAGLEIFEYGPGQIKLAITGHGKSDKTAVIKMIPLLIKIETEIKYDDEFDAIGIGLTHFAIKK